MKQWSRVLSVLALTSVLVAEMLAPTPAFAALSRGIRVTGSASSSGTVDITIESFSKPDFKDPAAKGSSGAAALISVPIPSGSTANQSAVLIYKAIEAGLDASYASYLAVPGDPATVNIDRNTGTFTMAIVETVGGQTVVEVAPVPIPTLSEWGLILLCASLAVGGVILLRRRRAFLPA